MLEKITEEQARKAFAQAVAIAIDKDYFSDILEFDLFPNQLQTPEDYEAAWAQVDKMFIKVFGINRYC